MEMVLQTKDLCKSFKKQKAVNNVSLYIEKGKVYGLLGPNGAGKSTTLKMITGVLRPTAGEIYFDGKPWSRLSCSDWNVYCKYHGTGAKCRSIPESAHLTKKDDSIFV